MTPAESTPKGLSNRFGQNVLFITPFASHPADAGQRRRVHQMASHLKRSGYRITFVLFALEMPWYWYFDEPAYREMVEAWDEVHVYPASKQVGLPPRDGYAHGLDEWWDPGFQQFLERLADIKTYDVVMVSNVWLSKAFQIYDGLTFKILDTHDIFSARLSIAQRAGIAPEFFWTRKEEEILGWSRADLVLTVTDEEMSYFGDSSVPPTMSIPIVPARARSAPRRRTYLHEDRVVFGVLSSAQIYAAEGLKRLLIELESSVADSYAPVDIVVAGKISDHVETALPVRKLGWIRSEDDFFDQVDFVLAPQFEGTGFKVKVADAMMAGMPILASEHSGIGTFLPRSLLFATPKALAGAMCRIALERPALSRFNALVTQATQALIAKRDRSEQDLVEAISVARGAFVFDLRRLTAAEHFPIMLSYISWTRLVSASASVFVLVDNGSKRVVDRLRNRWFRIVTEEELPDFLAARLEAIALGPFRVSDIPRHRRDPRWDWLLGAECAEMGKADGSLAYLPHLHTDVSWMPGLMPLAESIQKNPLLHGTVRRICVTEEPMLASALMRVWGASGIAISVTDRLAMRTLVAALLTLADSAPVEILWLCETDTPLGRLIHEIALSKHLSFSSADSTQEPSFENAEAYGLALLADLYGTNTSARPGITIC
ncbi:glycosyltransferase [Methylobacterium organophilum]|uniref:Glycosyltransferase n=1 Tax=Methylobacterium organophilum TaxID=410 RepID=A0ABQ4TCF2_METOR|nr:glycosyltransferase [Methylobacterium organophilum]GJE28580.1 hypothetical protein LKMONMHP_3452 [Methylobacterium organophilum]